ncbi:flagellar motor switch phosphatase FliY [Pseudalkalibacillus caeni]|uniref:Flagellar motor switch phosphatase FliY n=1 Tax=Exobacillus caeni TaxID=2574798 RepID=A0A5R9F0W9_9BACL|nr:flagellar motor switch phosphatase FliY [Pseudalkalibacillus caeni]TLS36641.1 flagellar motor switch phosphatase FliY [Pseudalkalibacillus caeni]
MTNDRLSPEEVKALLTQTDEGEEMLLTQEEQEILNEIYQIIKGSLAKNLSEEFGREVDLLNFNKEIVLAETMDKTINFPQVEACFDYAGEVASSSFFCLPPQEAQELAEFWLKVQGKSEQEADGEDLLQVALTQITHKSAEAIVQAFQMLTDQKLSVSGSKVNIISEWEHSFLNSFASDEALVYTTFDLKLLEGQSSEVATVMPLSVLKKVVASIMDQSVSGKEESATASIQEESVDNNLYDRETGSDNRMNKENDRHNIQSVEFSSFDQPESGLEEARNLNMLLDIPLQVTVELGRTKKLVKDILNLSPGSVVELDKLAGEPVDILINNKLIAKGEVVVIDENFGVRVTDILSTAERLSKLK